MFSIRKIHEGIFTVKKLKSCENRSIGQVRAVLDAPEGGWVEGDGDQDRSSLSELNWTCISYEQRIKLIFFLC